MEYALPALLTRQEILQILRKRQLHIADSDNRSLEDLQNIYKRFVLPRARREQNNTRRIINAIPQEKCKNTSLLELMDEAPTTITISTAILQEHANTPILVIPMDDAPATTATSTGTPQEHANNTGLLVSTHNAPATTIRTSLAGKRSFNCNSIQLNGICETLVKRIKIVYMDNDASMADNDSESDMNTGNVSSQAQTTDSLLSLAAKRIKIDSF